MSVDNTPLHIILIRGFLILCGFIMKNILQFMVIALMHEIPNTLAHYIQLQWNEIITLSARQKSLLKKLQVPIFVPSEYQENLVCDQ